MPQRTFTRDELDTYDLPWGKSTEACWIVDERRWELVKAVVFMADDGKYYEVDMFEPATEMQETDPWNYEDEIVADEVHEVEVLVKRWEKV